MKVEYESGQQIANKMMNGNWLWVSGIHEHDVGHLDEESQAILKKELDQAIENICKDYL